MSQWPVLTTLIFFPVAACLALPFLRGEKTVRFFSLGVGFIEILLALPLSGFDLSYSGYQFRKRRHGFRSGGFITIWAWTASVC